MDGRIATISATLTTDDEVGPGPVDGPGAPGAEPIRSISYEPGLDGLRAVALLSIFVVHADLGLAPGGFLAVSTFFTLSGFLITALLATEHARFGRIDLKAFWGRRARRLLPASLLAVVAICLASVAIGGPVQNANLRGDVVGSLAYVANWRFLLAGTSYGATYADQSPLLHFWSLAIEEQFYLVFPLLAVVAFALKRRWEQAPFVVLGLGAAASLGAGILGVATDTPPDHLYFRTDIRAGELLVGALFGLWWVRARHTMSPRLHTAIRRSGGVLLVLMVSLIATSDYHDDVWYRGGLLAYSLVTVGVVLAAVEPSGPVRRVLAWRPLVLSGMVSYAAYLVHWPIFLWLRTESSVPGGIRLVGGTAAALAVAALSHRLVEQPIRQRRVFRPAFLVGSAVVLLVGAVVLGAVAPDIARDRSRSLADAQQTVDDHFTIWAAPRGTAPEVGLFGDSTSLITTVGLATFDDEDPSLRVGAGWAGLGCSINAPATFKVFDEEATSNDTCDGWLEHWRTASVTGDLDVALVQVGPWEVKDVKLPGSDEFLTIGDPTLDALTERHLTEGIEALLADTPVVAIATSPDIEPGRVKGRPPATSQPDADPARMARFNAILERVAARYPRVAVIDIASWLEGSGEDDRLRPDGVHWSEETSIELAPRYARTLLALKAVAAGAERPTDTTDLFPVTKWAEGR